MSVPEGPPPTTTDDSNAPITKYRFKFHSDGNLPGSQSVLNSLVNIWNLGITPGGGSVTLLSAEACRWQTLNLLRLFIYRREHPALQGLGSLIPPQPGGLPSFFQTFWRSPRLSSVGVEIGSQTIQNKSKHIDIDWFGPIGDTESSNWWNPGIDGRQAELDTAKELAKFVEKALGVEPGGVAPEEWTWPQQTKPKDPLEAMGHLHLIPQVNIFQRVIRPTPLRIEWWVRDRRWTQEAAPTAFKFWFDHNDPPQTLFIETPDLDGPDPN